MSLPTGDWSWSLNANGHTGPLIIRNVDSAGRLTGTIHGQPISGFWNEAAKKITFIRALNPSNPYQTQFFHGYLFQNDIPGNTLHTLTGAFIALDGGGGEATRTQFGWVAQIRIPK